MKYKKNEVTKRKDLIKKIAAKMMIEEKKVEDVVNAFWEHFEKVLFKGDKIELRNFGVFQISERDRRVARNLKTNELILLPPKKYISFKPGKEMLDRLNPHLVSPKEADKPKKKRGRPSKRNIENIQAPAEPAEKTDDNSEKPNVII